MAQDEIKVLTGLRGVAALWVYLLHIGSYWVTTIPFLDLIISRGAIGVDIFFMLSGFVLTHVYHQQFTSLSWEKIKDFLIKRLARVYPVHFFMICVYLVFFISGLYFNFNKIFTIEAVKPDFIGVLTTLLLHLTLVNAWGLQALLEQVVGPIHGLGWNGVSWSVSAEWFAYLCFPFLAFGFSALRLERFLLFSLVSFALLLNIIPFLYDITGRIEVICSLMRISLEFPIGMLLYFVYQRDSTPSILFDLFSLLIFVFILIGLVSNIPDTVIISFLGLFMFCLTKTSNFIKYFFENRAMQYLGKISYSIYMIHFAVKGGVCDVFNHFGYVTQSTLYFLVTSSFLLISAHCLHQYLEEPMRKVIRNRFV